jgi:hypothetical protein
MHSIPLPCVYYFFLAVVVIGYETTATACWTLLFIVRAFFNDTITVAVWTGFHVRLMGMLSQPRDYIRWCFADPARPHDVRFSPRKRSFDGMSGTSAKCHVWTAPSWQELSSRLQHWSVQPCVRPVSAARRAAGATQ